MRLSLELSGEFDALPVKEQVALIVEHINNAAREMEHAMRNISFERNLNRASSDNFVRGISEPIKIKVDTLAVEAGKISWLVADGDSAANFTLTPRLMELVSEQMSLQGLVTFTSLLTPGETEIDGGNITTGTITVTFRNCDSQDERAIEIRDGGLFVYSGDNLVGSIEADNGMVRLGGKWDFSKAEISGLESIE